MTFYVDPQGDLSEDELDVIESAYGGATGESYTRRMIPEIRRRRAEYPRGVIATELGYLVPWVDHEESLQGCTERCPACRLERLRAHIG